MQTYTLEELTNLAAAVKAPDPELAAAVAMAEVGLKHSDGIYRAHPRPGDEGLQTAEWGPSLGLWQIRSRKAEYGKGTYRDASRLDDPMFNALAMMFISKGGTDFSPWTTYKSGKHLQHYKKGTSMAWRLAYALDTLRVEINAAYPDRPKQSDGTIGDTSHSARKSDHNPNSRRVVCAIDITRDERFIWKLLELAKKDPRVNYIIFDGFIYSRTYGFRKRVYTGSNKHRIHMHISLLQNPALYDDRRRWGLGEAVVAVVVVTHPGMREYPGYGGRYGGYNRIEFERKQDGNVARIQENINRHSPPERRIAADGYFGPTTELRVKQFQTAKGLKSDGIVGPTTWNKLEEGI